MSSTAPRKVLVIPAASVATSVTSASPIISAAAVEAVRCGLRRALSRASRPAAPPMPRRRRAERGGERPDEPRGEERDADEDQQRAERPSRARICVVPSPLPKRP